MIVYLTKDGKEGKTVDGINMKNINQELREMGKIGQFVLGDTDGLGYCFVVFKGDFSDSIARVEEVQEGEEFKLRLTLERYRERQKELNDPEHDGNDPGEVKKDFNYLDYDSER